MKIYLSPSDQVHNPYSYGGTNEAAQCRKIAEAARKALLRCGFEVETDFSDGEDAMYERVRRSNSWGADLHVCIHTNAGGGRGCVVFVSQNDAEHRRFADPVFEALDAITLTRSVYGVREASFYEIRHTSAPCLYVECEFHDSEDTARWIVENTVAIGEALCRGLCVGCGVRCVEAGENNDETENGEDENVTRWNTLGEIPDAYRAMAQRFVDAGALRGKDGGALDLSEDMLRTMEIVRRYFEEGA